MITIKLDGVEAVRAQFARLNAGLKDQALRQTATQVESYVYQQADRHTRTGALIQSIYSRPIPGGYEIGHDQQRAPHAVFVHWGTKPHEILPKQRKALRWTKGGVFYFAKFVRHPGNPPDKWIERAAQIAPRLFAQYVETLLRTL